MTSKTSRTNSSLQERANNLIEFQVGTLDSLAKGEDPKKVAGYSRDFLRNFYNPSEGRVFPYGADLGISINQRCNLRCSHCYYANTHIQEEEEEGLSVEQWGKVVSEAVDSGITHISIIGKEPLLSPEKTERVLRTIKEKREQGYDLKPEIITNGTLIKNNIGWLSKYPNFYFFNISFDGDEKAHDKIRGKGAYKKSLEGLRLAKKAGIQNLTALFTAMPHNISSIEKMVYELNQEGLDYLSIGYFFPTPYNKKDFQVGADLFKETIEVAKRLPSNLEISLNLIGDEHLGIISELYNEGFFSFQNLAVTEDLAPSLLVPLSEKTSTTPRVNVNSLVLPVAFYSGFRIDYDGTAMDFCTDLKTLQKRGFGNVQNESLENLYKKSQKEIWPIYTEKSYERLAKALRGEDPGIVEEWYESDN